MVVATMDPIYSIAPRPKLSRHVDNILPPSHIVNAEQFSVKAVAFTDRTLSGSPVTMPSISDPPLENNAAMEENSSILQSPLAHEQQVVPVEPLSLKKKRYSFAPLD